MTSRSAPDFREHGPASHVAGYALVALLFACRTPVPPPPPEPPRVEQSATSQAAADRDLQRALNQAFERVADGGQSLQLAASPEAAPNSEQQPTASHVDGDGSGRAPLRRLVLPDTHPMAPSRAQPASPTAATAAPESRPGTSEDRRLDLPDEMRPAEQPAGDGGTRAERAVRILYVNVESPAAGAAEVMREVRRSIPALGDCLRTHAQQAGLSPDEPLVVTWEVRGMVGGGDAAPIARHDPVRDSSLDRCAEGVLRRALILPDLPAAPLALLVRVALD